MHPASRIQSETLRWDSFSRSHDAVIRVYDEAGNVVEMHKHKGDFREF